jgi:predicted AAA+ superfamily ATPase
MDRKHLLELHEFARAAGRRYPRRRYLSDAVFGRPARHFVGIVGPRGVGKTILLEQMASTMDRAFYLSLDTLGEADLFDLVRGLNADYGFEVFLLDEMHFRKDAAEVLKKVFDFLDVRVVFTGSVALSVAESVHDLARRVRLLTLPPFSFREYLTFTGGDDLPALTFDDIENRNWDRRHALAVTRFDEYLKGGLMPFSLEEPEVLPLLRNILSKVLSRDVPSVARIAVDEVASLEKVMNFIGRSDVDGINYSSIARNVGITKYKAEQYVGLLETAFLLQRVFPRGANVTREPKILMSVPYRLLYREWDEALGGLREDFFAEVMRIAGLRYSYLKSNRGAKTPDYLVRAGTDDIIVEIGGRGKGRSQFKGVEGNKRMILTHSDSTRDLHRPLHLLGFLAPAL